MHLTIVVGLSLALPTSPCVRPALLETQGRIDPSFIVSSIFGLGLGLRWGFTGRGFGRRLGGKGREQHVLPGHPLLIFALGSRSPWPRRPLTCATPPPLPSAPSHPSRSRFRSWRARPRQRTSRMSRLLTPLRLVGWERADRPSWAGDAARVRVRCLSNSSGSTTPHFAPPLPGLDVARQAAYSLVNLLRCLRVCKYTRRIRMRILATHIKQAMSRKIEWAALPALVYLCIRASAIVRLRLSAHPVRNAHRSIPPVSGPLQHHTSLGLHVHPSLALVQTLSSRRGSRAPRDWALREEERVGESLRRPPSCLMLGFAFASPQRERRSISKSLPCLLFLAPRPTLWILVLGWGMLRLPQSRRRDFRLVSFPPSGFAPSFFPPAAQLPGQHHLPYTESTFHAISLKWRGRDPSHSRGWIMDHSRTRGRGR
ncbi:hypothetical protein B0H13DRAFT_720099 [Mycena leptocephala]|nr:hypothetical protein B0H13DRAFT_720099 [Mycena leptocephala]